MTATVTEACPLGYADLEALSYGELSAALNASDMPNRKDKSTNVNQIAAWARQGLARLGLDQARRIDARTRSANVPAAYGTGTAKWDAGAELRAVWGTVRRRDTAVDYGAMLYYTLRGDTVWGALA